MLTSLRVRSIGSIGAMAMKQQDNPAARVRCYDRAATARKLDWTTMLQPPENSPAPANASSRVVTVDDLRGQAGRLEALLNSGREDAAYCALVCHPHPAGGGTMHNKVVYHAMKTLSAAGLPCCASTSAAWA